MCTKLAKAFKFAAEAGQVLVHTEGGVQFYSTRTMAIEDKTTSSDQHQTVASCEQMADDAFLAVQQAQQSSACMGVNTDQTVAKNLNLSAQANSIMQLANVHSMQNAQQGSVTPIADKPADVPAPILTDTVRKEFNDAVAVAQRHVNNGLVKKRQLEPFDSVQAKNLAPNMQGCNRRKKRCTPPTPF